MCIAFLTDDYHKVDMLVEHIFLKLQNGAISSHEVYDVFIRPKRPWRNARILAISPHDLIRHGELMVHASGAPGSGGQDDVFYKDAVLSTATFDESSNEFSVTLPKGHDEYAVGTDNFTGHVVVPRLSLPKRITADPMALDVIQECGTVFEIALGDLNSNVGYAFRLVADPKLVGLAKTRTQDLRELDEVVSTWVQDLRITCPKTCRFNFLSSLAGAREVEEYAEAAATIQSIASCADLGLVPLRRCQIVLVLPLGAELIANRAEGCAWAVSACTLEDGRSVNVWTAGVDHYWMDDPESVARRIYNLVNTAPASSPKTKADIAMALDASQENCDLIVNALADSGALQDNASAGYTIVRKHKNELDRIFESVATSTASEFRWKGYQIRCSVQYRYLSPSDHERLKWLRTKRNLGFWLALVATAVALLSLLLALLT